MILEISVEHRSIKSSNLLLKALVFANEITVCWAQTLHLGVVIELLRHDSVVIFFCTEIIKVVVPKLKMIVMT